MTLATRGRLVAAAALLGLASSAVLGWEPGPAPGGATQSPMGSDAVAPVEEPAASSPARAARPAWVDGPADYSGPIHRIPVGSGPYATPQQARQALDQALQEQLAQYIAAQLGDERAGEAITYPAATIRQRWVPSEGLFEDTVVSSVGPMHRAFARLELGPDFRREVERQWRRSQSRQRLGQLGAIAGVVLGVLASVRLALGLAEPRNMAPAHFPGAAGGRRAGWLRRDWRRSILALGWLLGLVAAAGAAVWLLTWWLSWVPQHAG